MLPLQESAGEPPRAPGQRRPEAGRVSSPRARALPPLRRGRPKHVVLVVDDAKDARDIYAAYFESRGFGTLTAADGIAGVERAISARPDMIIMDLAMPRLDGVQATRRLKADRRTRRIPVIVVTAYADRAIAEGALEAGAADLLTKPCLPEDMEEAVRRLLARSPGRPAR